jgi:hypothetical protein
MSTTDPLVAWALRGAWGRVEEEEGEASAVEVALSLSPAEAPETTAPTTPGKAG